MALWAHREEGVVVDVCDVERVLCVDFALESVDSNVAGILPKRELQTSEYAVRDGGCYL